MKTTILFRNTCIAAVLFLMTACYEYPRVPVVETPYVDKTSLDIFTGNTEKIIISPSTGNFSITTDNPAVATITDDGTVTGVGVGFAVITVASPSDEVKVDVRVRDYVAVDSIVLASYNVLTTIGSSFQLFATIYPENATETIEWTSDNPAVASISERGVVSATALGQTVVTAKCGNVEKKATIAIPDFEKVDKTNWSVPGYDDNSPDATIGYNTQDTQGEASPRGRAIALYNNDYSDYWHARWAGGGPPPFPHWVIIDMGEEVEIGKIVTYKRGNQTQAFQYYISNDMATDAPAWQTPILEGSYASSSSPSGLTLTMTRTGAKGRYLKLNVLSAFGATMAAVCEIDVYRFKWD